MRFAEYPLTSPAEKIILHTAFDILHLHIQINGLGIVRNWESNPFVHTSTSERVVGLEYLSFGAA